MNDLIAHHKRPLGFEAGLAIVILIVILDRVCKQPELPAKRG